MPSYLIGQSTDASPVDAHRLLQNNRFTDSIPEAWAGATALQVGAWLQVGRGGTAVLRECARMDLLGKRSASWAEHLGTQVQPQISGPGTAPAAATASALSLNPNAWHGRW